MPHQRRRFSLEQCEYELGHILRAVHIPAALAQRGSINQIYVSSHEFRKRVLGARRGIAAEQLCIIHHAILVMATAPRTEQRITMRPCLATNSL